MGRDVRIAGGPIAPGLVLTAADADAARRGDIARCFAWRDPEPIAGDEIGAVHVETDRERLAKLARTGAEQPLVLDAAATAHQVNTDCRLERADEHRAG